MQHPYFLLFSEMEENQLKVYKHGRKIVMELPEGSGLVLGPELPIYQHPGTAPITRPTGPTVIRTIRKTTTTTETMTEWSSQRGLA